LWSQKECEDRFDTTNTVDNTKMEPYDSEQFLDDQKEEAFRNQTQIEHNIPRLVRIFRRDDFRAKLLKEFKEIKIETYPFLETFKELKKLWIMKLCTSLEEHNRNQEQLSISKKRVSELEDQLAKKTSDLETFTSSARDQKQQRQKEITELKEQQ
jgi:hypothetical protein